jgi:hypothetical protein
MRGVRTPGPKRWMRWPLSPTSRSTRPALPGPSGGEGEHLLVTASGPPGEERADGVADPVVADDDGVGSPRATRATPLTVQGPEPGHGAHPAVGLGRGQVDHLGEAAGVAGDGHHRPGPGALDAVPVEPPGGLADQSLGVGGAAAGRGGREPVRPARGTSPSTSAPPRWRAHAGRAPGRAARRRRGRWRRGACRGGGGWSRRGRGGRSADAVGRRPWAARWGRRSTIHSAPSAPGLHDQPTAGGTSPERQRALGRPAGHLHVLAPVPPRRLRHRAQLRDATGRRRRGRRARPIRARQPGLAGMGRRRYPRRGRTSAMADDHTASATTHVDAPAEEVFDFICRPANHTDRSAATARSRATATAPPCSPARATSSGCR